MIPDLTALLAEWAEAAPALLQTLLDAPELAAAAAGGALAGLLRLRLVVLAILVWAAAALWLAAGGELPPPLAGEGRLGGGPP